MRALGLGLTMSLAVKTVKIRLRNFPLNHKKQFLRKRLTIAQQNLRIQKRFRLRSRKLEIVKVRSALSIIVGNMATPGMTKALSNFIKI